MKKLWEILVPVTLHGVIIKKKFHKKWDKKVSEVAGGLTVCKPKKGKWLCRGKLFVEKMIRVRIAATVDEIEKISDITAAHYDQKAIMYYLISDEAYVQRYD